MSGATVQCYFTFNAEHNKLLDLLKDRTGKDKRQIIRDAIRLALSKGLQPARFRWTRKNHRVLNVTIPVEDAEKAKKLWQGKLTPLAVSGILEIAKTAGIQMPKVEFELTIEEIRRMREALGEISRTLQVLNRKLSPQEASIRTTNSTTAAKAVRATLLQLIEQLDYFKKGTEADRRKFRELTDPTEVGYITSLLRALFDEEGFQRWILATEFMMERRTND